MKTAGAEIMVRKASELDAGSRIIIGRAVREIVAVHDIINSSGAFTSLVLDNGGCIIAPAKELFACV